MCSPFRYGRAQNKGSRSKEYPRSQCSGAIQIAFPRSGSFHSIQIRSDPMANVYPEHSKIRCASRAETFAFLGGSNYVLRIGVRNVGMEDPVRKKISVRNIMIPLRNTSFNSEALFSIQNILLINCGRTQIKGNVRFRAFGIFFSVQIFSCAIKTGGVNDRKRFVISKFPVFVIRPVLLTSC